MDYRRLGSTGLKISCLGLGCGNFGGVGSAPEFYGLGENEQQAFELMEDTTRDGRRVRIYRATFGTTPVRVQFSLSPEGKIVGLGISPFN